MDSKAVLLIFNILANKKQIKPNNCKFLFFSTWFIVILISFLTIITLNPSTAIAKTPILPFKIEIKGKFNDKKQKIVLALNDIPTKLSKINVFLKNRLYKIGYSLRKSEFKTNKNGQKVLYIEIYPLLYVRHIFIRGNWPLFESDIMRRVIIRPGSVYPDKKEERDKLIDIQINRIEDYLNGEGYFDSVIKIKEKKNLKKQEVDLYIDLNKGSSYKLGKLTIKGNQSLSSKEIESFFRHKIFFYEKPFYKKQFKKDLKKLIKYYRKKVFTEVSIKNDFDKSESLDREKHIVNITLYIKEKKHIQINFYGNKKKSSDKLLGELTFVDSGTYDEQEIERSAASIMHYYQKNGYFKVKVYPTSYYMKNNKISISFYIKEGPQYRVSNIKIQGNKYISNSDIKDEISTKIFPKKLALIGLGKGGYITPIQLKQDAEKIVKLYKNRGFPDTLVKIKVIPKHSEINSENLFESLESIGLIRHKRIYVDVEYSIKEGKRILISNINIKGLNKKIISKFKNKFNLKINKPFISSDINKDLLIIKRYLANQGYPYASVITEIKADKQAQGVDISYIINKGTKVYIGPIFIRGNFNTRKYIIQREIPFSSGDIFRISEIEKAGRNLRSLGVFKSVNIKFPGIKNHGTYLPVVITVTERYDDYGELEIGGGFSTDNLYFTSFAYRNKNIFGFATSLELKTEIGTEIKSGKITYQDNRFLGTKLLFEVLGYGRTEQTVRLGDIITFGTAATIKKILSQRFQWMMRYEIRRVSYKEDLYRISSNADENEKVNFSTTTASIGPTVIIDQRDNPLVPQKGYRITSSLRLASEYLGGNDNFFHINISGQIFIPIFLGLRFASGIRYDHAIPFGGTITLPKVERFYAGGDTTIRGYEEDMLFTQIIKSPLNPLGGLFVYKISPLGGNIRLLSNFELQFPIWKHSIISMPIWGAFFFDTGYIINDYNNFDLTAFHSGYGTALRIVTPVGVISLEYAWPLNKVWGNDLSGRVHFNFGFIF